MFRAGYNDYLSEGTKVLVGCMFQPAGLLLSGLGQVNLLRMIHFLSDASACCHICADVFVPCELPAQASTCLERWLQP